MITVIWVIYAIYKVLEEEGGAMIGLIFLCALGFILMCLTV